MTDTIRDFFGTLFTLIEFVAFITLWGIAGGVEQDTIPLAEGFKKILICGGVMVVVAVALVWLCKTDTRE